MSASSWVHLEVELIVQETEMAFLFRFENQDEKWVPKSQISDADDYNKGDSNCTVSVKEWFAEKENLLKHVGRGI